MTIIILIAGVQILGCSTALNSYIIREQNAFKSNDAIKLPAYSKAKLQIDKVTLLPHQYYPIDYLHKHPEVKGLLINHYLGTGKTYLALGFTESFPNKEVIIIVPQFLVSNWVTQMHSFGIKDPDRFQIITLNEAPEKLSGKDLSKTILIIDEIHKLVKKVQDPLPTEREKYTHLYLNLQKSERILALTGTPIFSDASDIVYLLNLVSGQKLLPYNKEIFRTDYTQIAEGRSLGRGFLSESLILQPVLGAFVGLLGVTFSPSLSLIPLFGLGGMVLGFSLPPAINNIILPVKSFPLRRFNADKLVPLTQIYTSFYTFGDDAKDFPKLSALVREINLSEPQLEFFFDFAEQAMNSQQLNILLRESRTELI